jgi:hypothetical protein
MMSTAHAVPVLLLAGPGGVFAALALSYRWDVRRFAIAGDRTEAAVLAAAYGCLAALSYLWAVATAPTPALFTRPALGVGVALLAALARRLWLATRDRGWVSALAVTSASAPVGELEENASAHAGTSGTGGGTRQLALLHRKQCAVGTRHWHPHGTY